MSVVAFGRPAARRQPKPHEWTHVALFADGTVARMTLVDGDMLDAETLVGEISRLGEPAND